MHIADEGQPKLCVAWRIATHVSSSGGGPQEIVLMLLGLAHVFWRALWQQPTGWSPRGIGLRLLQAVRAGPAERRQGWGVGQVGKVCQTPLGRQPRPIHMHSVFAYLAHLGRRSGRRRSSETTACRHDPGCHGASRSVLSDCPMDATVGEGGEHHRLGVLLVLECLGVKAMPRVHGLLTSIAWRKSLK